jgi:hypothetical protein
MVNNRKLSGNVRGQAGATDATKSGATVSKLTSHIKNKVARSEAYNKLKLIKKVAPTFCTTVAFVHGTNRSIKRKQIHNYACTPAFEDEICKL